MVYITSHTHFSSLAFWLDREFKPNFLVFTFSANLDTDSKKEDDYLCILQLYKPVYHFAGAKTFSKINNFII